MEQFENNGDIFSENKLPEAETHEDTASEQAEMKDNAEGISENAAPAAEENTSPLEEKLSDNAAQTSKTAFYGPTEQRDEGLRNTSGGIFGEQSFAYSAPDMSRQTPPVTGYVPSQYGGYQNHSDSQYGNLYGAPSYGGYSGYTPYRQQPHQAPPPPPPPPPPQYGAYRQGYGGQQGYGVQGYGMQGYAPRPIPQPMPMPSEIPPVSDVPAAEMKKTSKGWIIAAIIAAVLALTAVMILLAMSHRGDSKNPVSDLASGSSVSDSIGNQGSTGVTVNINVAPKPVEEDEYYQNRETGLLTPAGAAKQVLPSIVSLYGYTNTVIVAYNEASGVIISDDGYIITNAHAVEEITRVKARLSDGSEYEAQIIGIDTKTDLAVLKIEADGLVPAVLGASDDLDPAEQVVAIGNAGGYNDTVTVGCVSYTDREINSYTGYPVHCVQTDAVLNFGNSGGALINLYGQVVGIVTSRYSSVGDERVGFAIKTEFAVPIVEDIIEKGYVTGRARVGVTYQLITAEMATQLEVQPGMRINEISDACDISNTELQLDDIITEMDGIRILTSADIQKFKNSHSPGDVITAKVYRKSITGEESEFEIKFRLEEETSTNN